MMVVQWLCEEMVNPTGSLKPTSGIVDHLAYYAYCKFDWKLVFCSTRLKRLNPAAQQSYPAVL
jgi:hypothetical protein